MTQTEHQRGPGKDARRVRTGDYVNVLVALNTIAIVTGAGLLASFFRPLPSGVEGTLLVVLLVAALLAVVVFLWMIHLMWEAISDKQTRTTPALASWLLLVPILNVGWAFIAFGAFPAEYRKFADRHDLRVPEMPSFPFVCTPVLLLGYVVLTVLGAALVALAVSVLLMACQTWMVALGCKARNAVIDAWEEKRQNEISRGLTQGGESCCIDPGLIGSEF